MSNKVKIIVLMLMAVLFIQNICYANVEETDATNICLKLESGSYSHYFGSSETKLKGQVAIEFDANLNGIIGGREVTFQGYDSSGTLVTTPLKINLDDLLDSASTGRVPKSLGDWTPAMLGNNLTLWLDAQDGNTFVKSGTDISQWNDKSGKGRNVTGFSSPQYTPNGINGKVAVGLAPNLNRYFVYNGNTGEDWSDFKGDLSVYSVFNLSGYASNMTQADIFSLSDKATSTTQYRLGINSNDATPIGYHFRRLGDISSNLSTSSSFDAAFNKNLLLGGVYGNNGIQAFKDGVGYTSAVTSGTMNNINALTIGARRYGNTTYQYANGYIGEVIATKTALTTVEREKLEGYLAWKWGLENNLPSNHPYRYNGTNFDKWNKVKLVFNVSDSGNISYDKYVNNTKSGNTTNTTLNWRSISNIGLTSNVASSIICIDNVSVSGTKYDDTGLYSYKDDFDGKKVGDSTDWMGTGSMTYASDPVSGAEVFVVTDVSVNNGNGKEVLTIGDENYLEASVIVRNTTTTAKNVILLIVYFENEVLKDIAMSERIVNSNKKRTIPITLGKGVNLTKTSGKEHNVRVYVWTDLSTLETVLEIPFEIKK